MGVPRKHILSQGPVIGALFKAGFAVLTQGKGGELQTPTAPVTTTVGPRGDELIKDYIRHTGGDPGWYKGQVPAHLFPQWGFPVFSQTLKGIPYDMAKVLNGGCRIEMNSPIPTGEKLHLSATLEDIDDNGSRAVLRQRLVTSTDSAPDAIVCTMYAIVPLPRKKGEKKERKERPHIPADARRISTWNLYSDSGMDFAVLTGDFNPVHWIPAYARAAGFKNCILHGFSTLARSIEDLNRVVFSGDPTRLKSIDVKFTRPLVLPTGRKPATPGVFLGDGTIFVGDAAGGPAYLTGEYTAV